MHNPLHAGFRGIQLYAELGHTWQGHIAVILQPGPPSLLLLPLLPVCFATWWCLLFAQGLELPDWATRNVCARRSWGRTRSTWSQEIAMGENYINSCGQHWGKWSPALLRCPLHFRNVPHTCQLSHWLQCGFWKLSTKKVGDIWQEELRNTL